MCLVATVPDNADLEISLNVSLEILNYACI